MTDFIVVCVGFVSVELSRPTPDLGQVGNSMDRGLRHTVCVCGVHVHVCVLCVCDVHVCVVDYGRVYVGCTCEYVYYVVPQKTDSCLLSGGLGSHTEALYPLNMGLF